MCCGQVFQIGKDIRINGQVNKSVYNWILKHPQVVQSTIANYCLKGSIDVHSETQLVSKL